MAESAAILSQLVELSQWLGSSQRDLAILGEGNTSARVTTNSFYVKASGKELRTAETASFVEVELDAALRLIDGPNIPDADLAAALLGCRTDSSGALLPSVETFLHAYLLTLAGVQFIGHTHPTSVNAILCSTRSRELVSGCLFPDAIVCCGPAVCYVEYTDPGLPLARCLRGRVEQFLTEYGLPPKVILLESHGFIACGRSHRDVQTITAMYEKTARILLGACAVGGPRFLTPENVARIHTRPDEHYRQRQIENR